MLRVWRSPVSNSTIDIDMLGRANRPGLLIKVQILRFKKFCILSIFVLSGLVLSGCATIPEVINLKKDESFTHDEIVAGMMGAGGVISVVSDLDESESSKYATILRDSFLSIKEDFVILPVEEIVQRLGNDLYQTILNDYKESGELNSEFLKELEFCQNAFRFLMLVRIIENEVTEKTEKCPRPEIPLQTDLKGNPIVKKFAVRLITTRHIRVSLDIYDLKKGISVWSGIINESISKERTAYFEDKDEDIVKSFALIPVRAFLKVTLQPSAPRTDKLLRKIFPAFAEYMP